MSSFILKSKLKDFQKETVKWMSEQEHQFSGGMLFSEAGTGKSISMISLLQKTYKNNDKILIVCPSSVIKNWMNEFTLHTNLKTGFDVVEYHGVNRKSLLNSDCKIMITSYNIINRDKELYDIEFKRIILDEAHVIRNSKTKLFDSIMELKSEYKWVMTATPIFNSSNDMFSYFKFIFDNVDCIEDWKKEYNKRHYESVKKLNALVKKHSLTYKKKNVLKELPSKKYINVDISFNDDEKDFYDAFKTYNEIRLKKLYKTKKYLKHQNNRYAAIINSNYITLLLRLRQCCNSLQLLQMKRIKHVKNFKEATTLLKFFNTQTSIENECPICYDAEATHIANPCGHKCCKECWDKLESVTCPMCRSTINDISDVREIDTSETTVEDILHHVVFESEKLKKIKELVNEIMSKNEKVVIVSQWVNMIQLIKRYIKHEKESVLLTGELSIAQRHKNVTKFQSNDDCKICYISLMACAEGINLTSANHLILVDSWFNEGKITQVTERIYRIGQTKNVFIYNLKVKDSIEDLIVKYSANKTKKTQLILNKWYEKKNASIFADSNVDIKLLHDDNTENTEQ